MLSPDWILPLRFNLAFALYNDTEIIDSKKNNMNSFSEFVLFPNGGRRGMIFAAQDRRHPSLF